MEYVLRLEEVGARYVRASVLQAHRKTEGNVDKTEEHLLSDREFRVDENTETEINDWVDQVMASAPVESSTAFIKRVGKEKTVKKKGSK